MSDDTIVNLALLALGAFGAICMAALGEFDLWLDYKKEKDRERD